jgi:hypothetical protein
MSKVCWVIPVHEPHFGLYAEHLLRCSRLVSRIDHVVVLTWRSEVDLFLGLMESKPDQIIVLEDYFSADVLQLFILTKSIINVKKLFAVKLLQDEYSRVIVSDCELNVYAPVTDEDILQHKVFFPFHTVSKPHLLHKVAAPAGLLKDAGERTWIMATFVEKGLYSWFSDLPIYEGKRLAGFWDRYSLLENEDFLRLSYETFDYILYQYHVAIESRLSDESSWAEVCLDFSSPVGSCWELGYSSEAGRRFLRADGAQRRPLWVSHPSLISEIPSAKMVFHTDRISIPGKLPMRAKIISAGTQVLRKIFRV